MADRTPTVDRSLSLLRCDIDLEAPGRHQGFLRLPHSVHRSAYGWIPIPIASIRNGSGPRVLLVAGNHGDEWEGQMVLGELLRELTTSHIRGQVVILPSLNFPAAQAGLRTSPIDGGNMNRAFPGDTHGTTTSQIAWWIEHVLLPGFDLLLDLHSGGSSLTYLPCVLAYRQPETNEMNRLLGLARAFGAPVSFFSATPTSQGRTLSAAALRQGVLGLATEIGGGGLVTPASMTLMRRGVRRVLHTAGLLPDIRLDPPDPTRLMQVGGDDHHVYTMESGLFEPLVEVGDRVEAGQPAARIHHHASPWIAPTELRFALSGTVLCKRVPAVCEPGDCLFQLGSDFLP
ncbi:MAG: deacylase [Rhodoferax sp.]|nr:deacylase [Rhodoferax sp.]